MTVLVSTHYMDEAERCHEIAYIAYGKLMARGTADEVIARVRPRHLRAPAGPAPTGSARELRGAARASTRPRRSARRCTSAAPTARRCEAAHRAATARDPHRWDEVEPTLEDVFIQLMGAGAGQRAEAMAMMAPVSSRLLAA